MAPVPFSSNDAKSVGLSHNPSPDDMLTLGTFKRPQIRLRRFDLAPGKNRRTMTLLAARGRSRIKRRLDRIELRQGAHSVGGIETHIQPHRLHIVPDHSPSTGRLHGSGLARAGQGPERAVRRDLPLLRELVICAAVVAGRTDTLAPLRASKLRCPAPAGPLCAYDAADVFHLSHAQALQEPLLPWAMPIRDLERSAHTAIGQRVGKPITGLDRIR